MLSGLSACVPGTGQHTVSKGPASTQYSQGIFTVSQADRGMVLFRNECARCHGNRLDDGTAPVLLGPAFLETWNRDGLDLNPLLDMIRSMDRLGAKLTDQDFVNVMAFVLQRNAYPAGARTLAPDSVSLGGIHLATIEQLPPPKSVPPPA
ncbi:MAG: cytochrome c, partial [Candidatus Latescibacteria bacterium]|nr:cytochrome c [Candidatus Latescibacterota bacterium]